MVMLATVIRRHSSTLLVRDHCNGQEVLCRTREAHRFRPGDQVRILYNGILSRSQPPQIHAMHITRLSRPACNC